ncbi:MULTISPECIES: D-alanyl-D-alanine carboxypeptidase [unclassified Streptomyces]|uniref:D-alanyl-D-alanine carboxypeptidase family protein n=1 Tax=unclassified Streptomyces TaxID=2593676 RepID=UPI0006F67C44|nr:MULTISPECIES: D-alanyl-D-alanine carboxypeptidase [unclassified Streptomyces]KQX59047.1 D-alanyl-D-alanine carboxypeptidase [Streptomyces sp. Root1304]KRB00309.1 D-alanyl-D-alanine carboxypeptidase [Streptomyces sp. Root66D1]
MSASKKTAWAVAAALFLPLVAAGPAHADPKDDKEKQQPKPPAAMSSVGGPLLGTPGTQVKLGPGAPVLPKELSGRSWIVADAENGQILASHNAHWPLAPASTLKMLFADTLLPKFPRTQNHLVAPADLAGMGEGSSLVGIKEKQTYSVHDLWLGVFLRSGNDAVHVLTSMNNGLRQTVKDMNDRAAELQALDTHVVSPDGYDAPGQVSSAYDLTLIARDGMQNPDFREYAATPRAAFPGEQKPGKKRETFEIQNTNRLLTGDLGVAPYQGIAGVKNGNTTHAGATFTGVAERNGKVLLVTVMNPSSKEQHAVYREAARLLDWGFAAAGKVTPVGELVPPRSARTGTSAPDTGTAPAPGKNAPDGPVQAAVAEKSGGVGIALAVAGGVLVLLAGAVFLVNRRWPLAGAQGRRRRSERTPDVNP